MRFEENCRVKKRVWENKNENNVWGEGRYKERRDWGREEVRNIWRIMNRWKRIEVLNKRKRKNDRRDL